MDDTALLEILVDLARRLGYEVLSTPLAAGDPEVTVRSGACRVGDRRLVLLDRVATPREKVAALLAALRAEELDGIYLPPAVRRLLRGE
jgi:hypothetical protein